MWAQDGSGGCLPTLRKTRLQKQEMIIFPACRYVILSIVVFTWTRTQHFVPELLYCVPHQSQLSVTGSLSRFCLSLPCINCYHWDPQKSVTKSPFANCWRPYYDVEDGSLWSAWPHCSHCSALHAAAAAACRRVRGHGATTGALCALSPLTLLPALCRVLQNHCSILPSPPPRNAATFGYM